MRVAIAAAITVGVTVAIALVAALVAIIGKRDEGLLLGLTGTIPALNNRRLCHVRAPQCQHQGDKDQNGGYPRAEPRVDLRRPRQHRHGFGGAHGGAVLVGHRSARNQELIVTCGDRLVVLQFIATVGCGLRDRVFRYIS